MLRGGELITMANEKRLIDANALIEEANAEGAYGYVDAFQIANAPTIDAVEVKHRRWIQQPLNGTHIWRCSKCETLGSPQWNYCPKCGAKMGDKLYG